MYNISPCIDSFFWYVFTSSPLSLDHNEMDLPDTIKLEFPDVHDIMNFNVIIIPDGVGINCT